MHMSPIKEPGSGHHVYEAWGLTVYTNYNIFFKSQARDLALLDTLKQWINLGVDNRSTYTKESGAFDYFFNNRLLNERKLLKAGRALGFTRGHWTFSVHEDYAMQIDLVDLIKKYVFEDLVFAQVAYSVNNRWFSVYVSHMGDFWDKADAMQLGHLIMELFKVNKVNYKPEIYKAFKLNKNNSHGIDVYLYTMSADIEPSKTRAQFIREKIIERAKEKQELEFTAKVLEEGGWFNDN